ncbi:hypothetical protein BDV30DRAFT_230735 [Aspergillus minisclerotigenes]|uniref:Uncharacterized protein n=1 Tax=Aspergillus minisclerotigenes TaxID=656917 RepID=A0A5N6IP21_9EURO|nr:hypothetical protein BDV30DRAFT_230735 [Aspergillus minisclerotigenes]
MGNISHPGDLDFRLVEIPIHYLLGNNILFAGYFSNKHYLSFLLPFFLFRFCRALPRSRASIGKNLPLHSTVRLIQVNAPILHVINVDPHKM